MSDLRLEWDDLEKKTLRDIRSEMPSAKPIEVFQEFRKRNHRNRSLHAVRPKLKELDESLNNADKRRLRLKSMWFVP